MKKYVKLAVFIVDLMFLPVRFVTQWLTIICGCIVHEQSIVEATKAMVSSTIFTIKTGWKPTMEVIFKD